MASDYACRSIVLKTVHCKEKSMNFQAISRGFGSENLDELVLFCDSLIQKELLGPMFYIF